MESSIWLSDDQTAFLRGLLERARDELRAALRATDDERDRLRLAVVQSALMRFDGGTYGECVRCEEPLAFELLRDRPEAALCTGCEASRRKVASR